MVTTSTVGSVWKIVPPKPWENDESGLILANKADIRKGAIPLLLDGWHSASDSCSLNKWVPYSDVLSGRSINLDKETLFVDEICIADQMGILKRIPVPSGASTHFFACGLGIFRHSDKLVFLNVSPHSWCGIRNASIATVDLRCFSIALQSLSEPGFICNYLERLSGHKADDPSSEIYNWSNCDIEIFLFNGGDNLLLAAEEPELTLEMKWNIGYWQVTGHKHGRCVPRNQAFYLRAMDNRRCY